MYGKVRAYITEYGMISPGDHVLAGVSGGGDSMAMLDMLHRLSGELSFTLEAVHVNHGIRGREADRDMELVRAFCKERGIPCRVFCVNVPALAREKKLGMEEAGRAARRKAFQEASEAAGKQARVRIALAHNQNDQAETVLHHLARGSALRGLGGIRPANETTIRPLLCLERREIDKYLEERKIPFETDSTNLEDDYTRNRIRHHILPLLEEEVHGGAAAHMAQAAELLAQADDYFAEEGRKLLMKFMEQDGSVLFREEFFQEHLILQKYGIMEAIGMLAGKRKDLTGNHVQQVISLWKQQSGKRVSLPCGVCAVRTYQGVCLKNAGTEKERQNQEKGEWTLPVPGELKCFRGTFSAEIIPYFGQEISEKKYTKWFDYDKIEHNLSVRTRRQGDFMTIDREMHRKKLKRCMIDDHIPQEERDWLPLVTMGSEVLWIVGGRISEKWKITSQTARILQLKYQGGYQDE